MPACITNDHGHDAAKMQLNEAMRSFAAAAASFISTQYASPSLDDIRVDVVSSNELKNTRKIPKNMTVVPERRPVVLPIR